MMTENDAFDIPVGIPQRNPNFMDGLVSHMASISPAQPNSFDLNSQTRVLAEFPALAMLQGGHLGNVHTGFPLSDSHDSIPRNVYSDALNSAFSTSLNGGYDGGLGGMTDKWGFDKCLALPEVSEKAPERLGFQTFHLMGNNTNPNGWNANNTRYSSELSLGPPIGQPFIMDQCSEVTTSGSERRYGSEISTSCNSKNLSRSFGNGKQVQIPQFLSGSRYLTIIQEILAEIVSYSLENLDQVNYPGGGNGNGAKMPVSSSCFSRGMASVGTFGDGRFASPSDLILRGREVEEKKKQLLALLQMVDEQYNQCVDEIHTVISAFHAATELDPRLHARFSLQTISSLYKSLRERISKQILAMGPYFDKEERDGEEDKSFETSFIQKQWTLQQLRRKDHQLWRPQRGLPERSVSVLRAWMFQNFLHPYPKDAEKHVLAVKSGLTRSQVSNWFINARVRLWKPMIEEMYAEMNRGNSRRSDEEAKRNCPNNLIIDPRRFNMN